MFANLKYFFAAFAVTVLCAGCAEDRLAVDSSDAAMRGPVIYATMSDAGMPATRTTIKTEDLTSGAYSASILWVPSDEIGVYTSTRSNLRFLNTKRGSTENVHKATFYQDEPGQGDDESKSDYQNRLFDGTVTYAYYPHDIANNDKSSSALPGTVPTNPVIDVATELIPRDYKWGELLESSNSQLKFKFHNLFSLAHFSIDAFGTALEGEAIETVKLSVTRNGNAVPVAGDFTFNAANGACSLTDATNELTIRWKGSPVLDKMRSAFVNVFPEIKVGDKLNFTITTKRHIATLSVTAKVDFEPEMYYTFPLSLSKFSAGKVNVIERNITQGTFTCATYNVDGLPKKVSLITINGDGPGESGTKNISAKIATQNWDFVGFSEDFEYNDALKSSLGSYAFGTHRGSVSSSALYKTLDTDGLQFAANTSTCSFSGETWTAFNSKSGGLTSGANTCIKKGVRYYLVTLKDGTEIDVVITHMNTYGAGERFEAQNNQLTEVANYINGLKKNKRPIIFMGDTNCRYTRNYFQANFWSVLDSDFEVHDPWVDYQWDGIYPTLGSKSLMVSDATGTDAKYDVIYDGHQKGEVVDKVIYINNPEAPVQISANGYNRDENFKDMADHMPIVVEFTYTKVN